jgi:hypothetical protein
MKNLNLIGVFMEKLKGMAMSSYADMPNKGIADKIVNVWELINENAQMQYRTNKEENPRTLQMLKHQEQILLSRAASLGLELAKKIIEEQS